MQIGSKVVRTHQFFRSEIESESDKSVGSNAVITTHQFLPPLLPHALSLRLKKRIWNIGKCHQLTCFLFKFLIPNLKKRYFFLCYIHRYLKGYISFPCGNIVSRKACPTSSFDKGILKDTICLSIGLYASIYLINFAILSWLSSEYNWIDWRKNNHKTIMSYIIE